MTTSTSTSSSEHDCHHHYHHHHVEISMALSDISFMPSKNIFETLVQDNGEATGGFNERVTYFTNKVTTKELPLIRFQTC